MKNIDRAYWAGLFDGEGCFTITRHLTTEWPCYRPVVHINMADKDTIYSLPQIFECGHSHICYRPQNPNHQPSYAFSITKRPDIIHFIELILPYMKTKRKVARAVLMWCKIHGIMPRGIARKHYKIPQIELDIYKEIQGELHPNK